MHRSGKEQCTGLENPVSIGLACKSKIAKIVVHAYSKIIDEGTAERKI